MFTRIKRIWLIVLSSFAIMVTLTILLNLIQYFFKINLQGSSYQWLAIISLMFGFGSAIIGLRTSRWMAKRSYNIQLFDQTEYDPKLSLVYQTVRRIADQNGITMPEVWYYQSAEVNAFATGPGKDSALVAVSTGLVRQMDDEAIRGVIGHEMAHILNGDMVTTTLLQWILNTLVIFLARILAGIISGAMSDDDEGWWAHTWSYFLISNMLDMVFWLGVTLIIMWHSRVREFAADAGSVQFLGSKEPMRRWLTALQKLYDPRTTPNDSLSTLKISGGISGLFASHPPIEARIAALDKMSWY
jgi:heat shock protein HtpX